MAMAVALEFEIQDLTILPYTMPIVSRCLPLCPVAALPPSTRAPRLTCSCAHRGGQTSLAVSAIDQLARSDVRKSAINDLGRVLRTDLVTFRYATPLLSKRALRDARD
eukprot:2387738-Rhodomonas_salina.1